MNPWSRPCAGCTRPLVVGQYMVKVFYWTRGYNVCITIWSCRKMNILFFSFVALPWPLPTTTAVVNRFFFSSSFFSSSRRLSFLLLLLFFAFFSSSSLFFVFLSPSARAVLLRILKSFYSSPCYLTWFIIILTKCSWYNLQCCIQSNYRSLKQVNFPIDFFHISY